MERTVIKSERLGEEYYSYKHKSGLTILLYPMKKFSSVYAVFGTNYGSVDTTFKTDKDNDFVTVPEGIAHFLEHKLFESEDGSAFELFAKTGASANAFTAFDRTCYLFSTTSNFEESLKALVTFVQSPYFTKENVEKEQGIIGQEIRMYEDEPEWRVMFNLLGCLYHNNPVKIDIAGTKESIAKIDDNLLYRCYNAFYNLSNMVIAVAGNFDEENAVKIIEENLKPVEKIEVTSIVPDEPEEIVQKEFVQNLQVAAPQFSIGYKETPLGKEDGLFRSLCYSLIFSAVLGNGSDFYRDLYKEGLITPSNFGYEVFEGRGYTVNMISGESQKPKLVFTRIVDEFERIKESGIDEETFNRVKKSIYGRKIISANDVEVTCLGLVDAHFSGDGYFDEFEILSQISLADVNRVLRESFDKNKVAISIVNPA